MSAKEESEEERSVLAGACVLVVLGGVVVAAAFAYDEAAGVLLVVVAGVFALWRSARRVSDSSATPPTRGVAPDSDERARRRAAKARGVYDPNGVMCILHEQPAAKPDPAPADDEGTERRRLQAVLDRVFPLARRGGDDR